MWQKLVDIWKNLRPDLRLHVAAGAIISFVGATLTLSLFGIFGAFSVLQWWVVVCVSAAFGAALGGVAGWIKEYEYDEETGGVVDRQDFLYTGRAAIVTAIVWAALLIIVGALNGF